MIKIKISGPESIRGVQLAGEIKQTTSLDVDGRLVLEDENTLQIAGDFTAAEERSIRAVVSAHVPVVPDEPEVTRLEELAAKTPSTLTALEARELTLLIARRFRRRPGNG